MRARTVQFVLARGGLETVEYAVVTTIIVAGTITAIGLFAVTMSGQFANISAIVTGGG
ncbi:MAG: hypothetical protein KJ052_04050 [Candidatus Hydrogenedentes bacterium]|nr:hypothetical protein [Candidatus Hydrogenedentota bacterium]